MRVNLHVFTTRFKKAGGKRAKKTPTRPCGTRGRHRPTGITLTWPTALHGPHMAMARKCFSARQVTFTPRT